MWFPLWKAKFLQLFETLVILWGKARRSQILLFGVDSDCFALDWQEKSTLENSTEKHRGDHMAHLVIPFQYEISATIRKSSDLVSQGQRLVNPSVCSRFARDIHTWKFNPIAKGGPHEPCGAPCAKWCFWNSSKLPRSFQPRPEASKFFQSGDHMSHVVLPFLLGLISKSRYL